MTKEELNAKLAENANALQSITQAPDASSPVAQPIKAQWWSTQDAMTMSATLLIFGVVVLAMATYVIKAGKKTDSVIKVFGTVLIVVVAVFLVVAGYSETQIAPVMGLLGTIAGYILGKDSVNDHNPSHHDDVPDGDPKQPRVGPVGAGGGQTAGAADPPR